MRYISTRGQSPPVSFLDAVLQGMAPDGGLYVPEEWPTKLNTDRFRLHAVGGGLFGSYEKVASDVLFAFGGHELDDSAEEVVQVAYGSDHMWPRAVTPLPCNP